MADMEVEESIVSPTVAATTSAPVTAVTTPADVELILQAASAKEEAGVASITVEKEVPVTFDVGHLTVQDPNLIDVKGLRANPHSFLQSLVRGNVQLLINNLWQCERMTVDGSTIAKLPEGKMRLPRVKPVPQAKKETKWESFAKKKGIVSKSNREKKVWDEERKEWVPRYGYKSSDNQSKDWVIEAKVGPDGKEVGPEDAFSGKKKEKRERTAKNEYQRLKNIARGTGNKRIIPVTANNEAAVIPEEGNADPSRRPVPKDLEKAARLAKESTASLGKFQQTAVGEKPVKGQGGKKRTFEANEADLKDEKNKNLKLMDEVLKHKPLLNVKKAVANKQQVDQAINREQNDDGGKKKFSGRRGGAGRGRGGGGGRGGGRTPSGPKGKYSSGTRVSGGVRTKGPAVGGARGRGGGRGRGRGRS